ncbi:hypothetical protein [Paracoccus sp. pheM1]|uniref:hypothetical protein n=1 Tax=Paracoccus sp. pheM1 TaxID=2831675 RepID=UPI001BDB9523|nr:hypothetical protein [Paracoccus sp. pheM1]MBT0781728.1 hypothetical protein [Paracoccus sp. pheM1]
MERVLAAGIACTTTRPKPSVVDGLEQAFLVEMLKLAGPGQPTGEFGGGIGESQFASLLNDTYAEAIAERIDIGFQRRNEEIE